MKRFVKRSLCALLAIAIISAMLILPASADSEPTGVDSIIAVKGFQRSEVTDGYYALRFVAGLGSEKCTDFGMIIKYRYYAGGAGRFTVKGGEKLSEIQEITDGKAHMITAEELGVESLFTAVLEGIPADAVGLTVEVVPYCTLDGNRVEGAEKIFIIDVLDGDGIETRTSYSLADHKDKIKIYGRSVNLVSGIACDYSASGIEFNACVSGDVVLKVSSDGVSYYTLYIDGVRIDTRFEFADGTKDYVIAEDLAEGEYNFKLIKQTQAPHSLSTMMALKIDGVLLDRPADKELLIEFIGDSITCGYGLVGYPTEGVTNYGGSKYMDATLAYAYKTAEALGADHSLVSLSGWAVLPSAPGVESGCVPAVYGKTCYRRGDAAYTPERTADIVVIHLGTNDLYSRKDTYDTDFVSASKAFIADVKATHPDAKIVWVYGSMMTGSNLSGFEKKVNTIINDLGGAAAGFYSVKVPQNSSGANNSHPNVTAQARSAEILTEFIRANCLD